MIIRTLHTIFAGRQINLHVQSQLLKSNQYLVVYSFICNYDNNIGIGQMARMLSSHYISKNIEFLTQDNQVTSSKNIIRNTNVANDRPLLVVLTWLLSKRQHVMKFVNLYMEQGFDVTVVSLTPRQLLWPQTGSRLIAADLLTFLKRNESYQRILLHGFSVGGYMWGEVLDIMESNKDKYSGIADRIVGQVWDSIADVTEIPVGFPIAVFPKNKLMRKLVQSLLEYHMRRNYEESTRHYIRSSQVFRSSSICVPALLFVSKTDPVGTVSSNLSLRDDWESTGIKTYVKIFEESPHVAHFYKYPKEYVAELYTFLQRLNLIRNEEKIKARL